MKKQRKQDRFTDLNSVLLQAQAMLETDPGGAIKLLEKSQRKFNKSPELLNLLAAAYNKSGRTLDTLITLDRIIEIGAATAETWSTAGFLLVRVKEHAQAISAYQHAVELAPNDASFRHDYGKVLYEMGEVAAGARQIEKACHLCEELLPWQSLATLAPGNPEYTNNDVLRIRQTYCEKLAGPKAETVSAVRRALHSPLRVGYFSSWFDRENYMKPVWGLINEHSRERFDLHLLTDTPAEKLPGYRPHPGDHIHETGHLINQQLADLVSEIELDVLVDLNAYSELRRLGLFVRPLAPVTAAWFNMYATSGFPGFDYIIGDHVTVKPHEESAYSEKVLRLPQSYLSFVVSHTAPPVVDPPCVKNGFVTFGSLSSQYKLTRPVLDSWSEILKSVPSSRLILGNVKFDSQCNRDFVKDRFVERGVDEARLEFRGKAPHREFLGYYNSIDIALDPFPYNGGTTTMEAIWQGVPVIAFDGDRWASRTSASILAGTHLSRFVAADQTHYVQTAIELATSPEVSDELRDLRHSMREQLLQSPVCDAASLARAMENLFVEMTS